MALLEHLGQEHTCENCVFWQARELTPEVGECRRHSPAPSQNAQQLTRLFPWTAFYDKCGDWEFQP